jgi:hypothetical protein
MIFIRTQMKITYRNYKIKLMKEKIIIKMIIRIINGLIGD